MSNGGSNKSTRILSVEGYDGRRNDIIYVKRRITPAATGLQTIVFFPGDVQDYSENMLAHRDNHRYVEWNLESTAVLLSDSFPEHDVMVVKCSLMCLKTFACYNNFALCNQIGEPSPDLEKGAHRHLMALVRRTYELIGGPLDDTRDQRSQCPSLSIGSLALVGFSRGCIVLNQLVHEMHHYRQNQNEQMSDFVSRTKDIYWLDSGHSGGSNVWITDSEVLGFLATKEIHLHVHGTPYQIKDQRRPWIRREEKLFTSTLRKMNANITRVLHFGDEEPSIDLHFKVLKKFNSALF